MTPLDTIYLLIVIVSILFFGSVMLNIYLKVLTVKKEIAEANTKVVTKVKFVKVNYDNDILVIKKVIEDAVKNNSLVNFTEYYDNKVALINDSTLIDSAKATTLEIWKSLSTEYKELLEQYVDDPMMFIYKDVYYQTLDICVNINSEKIKNINNKKE